MNGKTYFLIFCICIVSTLAILFTWLAYKSSVNQSKPTGPNLKPVVDTPKVDLPMITKYDVPILMYHYIRNAENEDQLGKNLSVSPETFNQQITWLKNNNYQTIKLQDLADPSRKQISKVINEGKKPIAITFDDGYLDAYTNAFPVLKQNNFLGTFFVIRNFVGKAEYMNKFQIDGLIASNMEIGSHTLSHLNLTSISKIQAESQISESKMDSNVFCYPSGKYDLDVVDIVKKAGYVAAVTTKPGIANQDSKLFELPRVRMQDFSTDVLKSKLQISNDLSN